MAGTAVISESVTHTQHTGGFRNKNSKSKVNCRCLICYCPCSAADYPPKNIVTASPLSSRLHVIFILRKLLEVPYDILEKYLTCLGDPFEKWVPLCFNCSTVIDLAEKVYHDLMKITRKYHSLKKIIIEKVKDSKTEGKEEGRKKKRKLGHPSGSLVTSETLTVLCREFVRQNKYNFLADPLLDGYPQTQDHLFQEPMKSSSSRTKPLPVVNGELTYLYVPQEDTFNPNKSPATLTSGCDISHPVEDGDGGSMNSDPLDASCGDSDDNNEQDYDDDNDKDPTYVARLSKPKSSSPVKPSKRCSQMLSSNESTPSVAEDNFKEYPINENSKKKKKSTANRIVRFTCPYCESYRFQMTKGEEFCEHLEICPGAQGEKRNKLLCCPICQQFKRTINQRIEFVEHLPVCYGGNQKKLSLDWRVFACDADACPGPPNKYFKLDGFIEHYARHRKYLFRCALCPTLLLRKNHARHHFRAHHPESVETFCVGSSIIENTKLPTLLWWCPVCPESGFKGESLRDSHVEAEHPDYLEERNATESAHKCQFCFKKYACPYEVELHEGTEHVSQKFLFQCEVCSETFHKDRMLQIHRSHKHRLDLLVCDICGTKCVNNKTLQCHMQLHQDVRKYPCSQCEKSFTTPYFLKCHTNRDHADTGDPSKNPQLCPICNTLYYSSAYLKKHIRERHERKFGISCEMCGRGCQSNSHLKRHLSQVHKIGDYGQHKCTYEGCKKVFWDRNKLRLHLTQHTGQPQFKCSFCAKEFYYKTQLQRHELIHTNAESKPYQCEICSKRFPVRNYLYIHMRSHRKDRSQ